MPKAVERTAAQDPIRVQDNVAKVVDPLLRNPLIDGRLIEGVVLGAATAEINHGLGRTLKGWFVTRRPANVSVWDVDQDANRQRSKTLKLQASAAVTVDIYVF